MTFDPFANGTRKGGIGRSYMSPGQVAMGLEEQVSMAHYIPGGGFGGKSVGKGTVIPHHKPGRGGGSLGYNPHKPPHRNVLIDPHVPGRTVALDLAKVSREDSAQAYSDGMDFADEFMGDPPEMLDDIKMDLAEGPRLGAYMAAKLLAEQYGATPSDALTVAAGPRTLQLAPGGRAFDNVPSRPTPPPGMTGQSKAAAFGAPTLGKETPVKVVTGAQPGTLARFQQPRPALPVESTTPTISADGRASPPQRKVIFEFSSKLPPMPFLYHDVIRAPGALILVWDLGWPYGEPYSPEGYEEQFAVSVDGANEDFLVASPGKTFTFEHHGFRFYHLGILETMPKQ